MPFIRGRYHMNPVAGQALEAARQAEAAFQALEHAAKRGQESDDPEDSRGNGSPRGEAAPIHHVEIEAAELVPSHSGRAQRGFVARVHRKSPAGATPASNPAPETHVFAHHNDLTDFLNDEFAKDVA
ncbi:MAG TPA: hypothetical protein VNV84_05350 [Candidatus Acidoferrales bacterium]|jgi:hypothetical protein|nr:hypothetical protein [Candidatus Acidoferrales bacterium]